MKKTTISSVMVLWALFAASGCRVNRNMQLTTGFDMPNDIRARGFRYLKKGIEARHVVKGIWPASSRATVCGDLNVAQIAYGKLWRAAGGIKDNQRLINVMVEVSLIWQRGAGERKFLVVQMYADLIEIDSAGAGSSRRFGTPQEAARRAVALIRKGVQRIRKRQS